MRWILVRHGIAWDRMAKDCPPDPERPLTLRGMVRTRAAMRGLALQLDREELVLASSPYLRAMQSAEIAAEVFRAQREVPGGKLKIHRVDALSPGGDFRDLCDGYRWPRAQTRILFGHSPDLERFAAHLLQDIAIKRRQTTSTAAFLKLKKSGAICIQADSPAGPCRLAWVLPPRQLRELGRLFPDGSTASVNQKLWAKSERAK